MNFFWLEDLSYLKPDESAFWWKEMEMHIS